MSLTHASSLRQARRTLKQFTVRPEDLRRVDRLSARIVHKLSDRLSKPRRQFLTKPLRQSLSNRYSMSSAPILSVPQYRALTGLLVRQLSHDIQQQSLGHHPEIPNAKTAAHLLDSFRTFPHRRPVSPNDYALLTLVQKLNRVYHDWDTTEDTEQAVYDFHSLISFWPYLKTFGAARIRLLTKPAAQLANFAVDFDDELETIKADYLNPVMHFKTSINDRVLAPSHIPSYVDRCYRGLQARHPVFVPRYRHLVRCYLAKAAGVLCSVTNF